MQYLSKIKPIYWVLLVFVLAFALRFLWLGNITQIYFDEVNYLYDALKYQQGLLSFERESIAVPKYPLLSLLFMQYGMIMFGFNYLGWRFFSVLFGALSVAAFYLLMRKLFSLRAALIAAFLLSIDFLHIALSRIAMVEIYLLFFLITAFYFLARNLKHEKGEGLLLAGTFFGLALATKWPAMFGILTGLIIYYVLSDDPKKLSRGIWRLIVYPLALFFVVSMMLNLSAGMNLFSWLQFEARNFTYHQMFSYHHPFNASALTWPFILRSTPLFASQMGESLVRFVIAFGNPAVYWLLVPVFLFLINEIQNKKDPSVLFVVIGFCGMYLPWVIYEALGKLYIISNRGLFFYYFLPAVPFYIAALSYLLDRFLNNKTGKILVPAYLAVVFTLFLLFSPIIFGYPISIDYLNKLIWLPGWVR